jgi:hypothetical protein
VCIFVCYQVSILPYTGSHAKYYRCTAGKHSWKAEISTDERLDEHTLGNTESTPRLGAHILKGRKLVSLYESDSDCSNATCDDIYVLSSESEDDGHEEEGVYAEAARNETDYGYMADSEDGWENDDEEKPCESGSIDRSVAHYSGKTQAWSQTSRKRTADADDEEDTRNEAQIITIAIPGQRLPKRRCISPVTSGKTALQSHILEDDGPTFILQQDNLEEKHTPQTDNLKTVPLEENDFCEVICLQEGYRPGYHQQTDWACEADDDSLTHPSPSPSATAVEYNIADATTSLCEGNPPSPYNHPTAQLAVHDTEIYRLLDEMFD